MAKDAVATMGGLLPDDAKGRDAVHVAVFSAHSAVKLFPGQDVGAISDGDGKDVAVAPLGVPAIGIVDPFLKSAVMPGERFWVYLYPRTITALSHRWSHPAFESAVAAIETAAQSTPSNDSAVIYVTPTMKLESERWLRDECANNYNMPSYERLLDAVEHMGSDDEYLMIFGIDASGDIPGTIWGHIENVLGRRLPAKRPTYFSCSC